ncbi:hypothetical protein ABMA27_009219 [Loxostege sticticalis]|uniref:Gustatory receptor n=1 Tax=Loxostege sticticalis TaxID=481309 RepID=A0ABR3HAC5_LOXSC
MISKKKKVNLYECLLNNYIDDDMQSFLRPLELSQHLMFQSKFTIRDNFITPNGHLYNTFALTFESVYFFITDMILTFMDLKMVYAIRIMKLLTKILNSWIENMQNSNMFLNVELEASNEKLDDWKRLMKVYHNLSDAFLSYKKVFSMTEHLMANILTTLWSAKSIFLIWLLSKECEKFYISLKELDVKCMVVLSQEATSEIQKRICKNVIRLNCVSFSRFTAFSLFTIDASLPVDFTHQVFSYLIIVLQTLQLWLNEMKILNKEYSELNREESEFILNHWKDMEKAFCSLIKAFLGFEKVFGVPKIEQSATVNIYLLKHFVILVILCAECSKMYATVTEISVKCSSFTRKGKYPETQRRINKNITRLIHYSFNKIKACSMFEVDIPLVVNLVQALATYLVVLLQFAYHR